MPSTFNKDSAGNLSGMSRLAVRHLVMQFPGVWALNDVSVEFSTGEVHSLIGENGAGKSTLLKILSGIQLPTSGETAVDDQVVQLTSVKIAEHYGVAMVHQELNLIDTLTVAENICLGSEPNRAGLVDRATMRKTATEALAQLGAPIAPDRMVGELPLASKQMIEIAKAVAQRAKFLILDEPTAVLAEAETEALMSLIHRLKDEGVGVIYVSHRLDEVCALSDRVTVLRDGQVVARIDAATDRESINPHNLANLMVGRELEALFPPKITSHSDEIVLELNEAVFEGFPAPVSLKVHAGEIVGLGGLIGAGRTEIAEGIIRKRRRLSGSVMAKDPAYVSEDRKGTGLHLTLELKENTTMASLTNYGKLIIDERKQITAAQQWIEKLGIRAPGPRVAVQSLSGGNQQKVSLAKWLDTQPRLLILDEPTRGVDIGAKSEIYQLIHELAAAGMGCLVISSEMNELIGLCDRVVVLRERRCMGELVGEDVTESKIMLLAAGVGAGGEA